MSAPRWPVAGSIGVRVSPRSLVTKSVFRSHDGATCWGSLPTAKWSMTAKVVGSITSTVLSSELGTHTRGRIAATVGLRSPALVWAYTSPSGTLADGDAVVDGTDDGVTFLAAVARPWPDELQPARTTMVIAATAVVARRMQRTVRMSSREGHRVEPLHLSARGGAAHVAPIGAA